MAGASSPPNAYTVSRGADGQLYLLNRETGEVTPLNIGGKTTAVRTPVNQSTLTQQNPDGSLTTVDNPAYQPPPPAEMTPNAVVPFIPVRTYDPQAQQWTVKWEPNMAQVTAPGDALGGLYESLEPLIGREIPLPVASELMAHAQSQMQLQQQAQTAQLQRENDRYGRNVQMATDLARQASADTAGFLQHAVNPDLSAALAQGWSKISGLNIPTPRTRVYDPGTIARDMAAHVLADSGNLYAQQHLASRGMTPVSRLPTNADGSPQFAPPGAPAPQSYYQQIADQIARVNGLQPTPPLPTPIGYGASGPVNDPLADWMARSADNAAAMNALSAQLNAQRDNARNADDDSSDMPAGLSQTSAPASVLVPALNLQA